jgi:hypothetical protein
MVILYRCNLCANEIKKLYLGVAKKAGFLKCECGGNMEQQLPNVSTSSFEVVDNGNMEQKIYLRKDAKKLAQEKGDAYIRKIEEREDPLRKKS